jgi:N-acetylmuramoyl-L-alanine amidase
MKLDPKDVGWIVIHTAAAPFNADVSAKSIRAYHKTVKGWNDIGYHFVVRKDGTVEIGRPLDQMGAQVEGFNSKSIGICFSGHGDLADFTVAQYRDGVNKVVEMLFKFHLVDKFLANPMRVIGHREVNELIPTVFGGPKTTKTCPGKKVDMSHFRKLVLAELGR